MSQRNEYSIPLLDLIEPNLFGGHDIIINHKCLYECTYRLHINLENKLDGCNERFPSDDEQLIFDKRYDIIAAGMKIYSGILSHDNIFPNRQAIPFNLLTNHKVII